MHMADALLSPEVGGAMWMATGATIAIASRKLKRDTDHSHVPLMGVVGAFVFAAQMVNFTIPGTGSSGHFAGGMLLAILLGPHAAFLSMASVLVVQGLFFADGGLLAMGANIFNMGFLPCYVVYPLLYRPLAGGRADPGRRRVAAWLGAVAALQLGALGVVLETRASGIAELPLFAFLAAMQPIHLAIGIVEGLITVAVIEFVARAEPGMLTALPPAAVPSSVPGFPKRALAGLAILAIVVGGFFSWLASAHPDGLEWSIARLTGEAELAQPQDGPHGLAARIQEAVAFLPDYAFPASGTAESAADKEAGGWITPDAGTTVSGLVGGGLTLLIAGFAGWALRRRSSSPASPTT
ncbi:energy-coupling factor ABC transporter permease [Shumkonia mesophila]|uniref:energy-coupling factor ABC transporter permease n=1 Tax=Shumkonia mesophila TaxID=2838854 RepID=UPI002934DF2F|nr:energy-coupling factor ABC transporter permease [Shumkonia mesophila]